MSKKDNNLFSNDELEYFLHTEMLLVGVAKTTGDCCNLFSFWENKRKDLLMRAFQNSPYGNCI